MEVLLQTKVWLTSYPDKTIQDRKQLECYIHLKEVGGDCKLKSDFWAKMYGDNALLVFKPGQKVTVDLSFHVHKNSRKFSQRVTVNKISLVQDDKKRIRLVPFPWDDDYKAPWDD